MNTEQMTAKMAQGNGFIAALDQSGGSTPKALKGYGIDEDAWSTEEEMFGLIHAMRARIISSPAFTGDKVIGAILFERTMDGEVNGKPVPAALIEKGIVPFIKIDKGLEEEANGVQLMKPMPTLDALLERAKALGVYGTKERSVIHSANEAGIAAVVKQQFDVARQVLLGQTLRQGPADGFLRFRPPGLCLRARKTLLHPKRQGDYRVPNLARERFRIPPACAVFGRRQRRGRRAP